MEKFMTLLQEKLTPIANFCGTERHFASMQKGFMSAISFILVSAVFMILANPPVTADLGAGRVLVRLWPLARFCHGQCSRFHSLQHDDGHTVGDRDVRNRL